MDLDSLLASGETLTVEFKHEINDKDLYEAVACLSNGEGGTLLIGVDDRGRVVGAAPRHRDRTDPARLSAAIQNNTEPPLPVETEVIATTGGDVICIRVPRGDPGPVGTKRGVFVKRVIASNGQPACVPITPHELISRAFVTRGIDYASSPAAGATMTDLDPGEFDRFRRLCRTSGDEAFARLSDKDIAAALSLAPRDHEVSLGMILLFGSPQALERWTPAAELLFQDLRSGPAATNERLRLPLFALAEAVQDRLEARHTVTEVIVGLQRVDIPLISVLTRRESVANALLHRDYSSLGPTTVQLTDTEFSVSNPGGFPPGVTIHNLLERTMPRSMALAEAFRRAGLVDRKGKGVNEMYESQLRAGRDAPDYSRTTADSVAVTVSLSSADLDLVRFLATFQHQRQRSLSLPELRVVHEVRSMGAATISDLCEHLTLTAPVARSAATSLVEGGVLEARGNGRQRRFHLSAQFYALAEDRAAYVRVKPVSVFQQKQMVLDYVRAYGRITRGQAAGLCQLSPPQARTLLKQLTDEDDLRLVGQRRTAHYVLPD